MATVYPNIKNGKIVSFKFKVFLGRDENGKQIFKCKTWKPEKQMSESKLKQLAEKESSIWERQALKEHEESLKILAPEEITFSDFVSKVWFVNEMNLKKCHNLSLLMVEMDFDVEQT